MTPLPITARSKFSPKKIGKPFFFPRLVTPEKKRAGPLCKPYPRPPFVRKDYLLALIHFTILVPFFPPPIPLLWNALFSFPPSAFAGN